MHRLFSLNKTVVTAFFVVGSISLVAIVSQYPGLIELQCSADQGCRVVIDGR